MYLIGSLPLGEFEFESFGNLQLTAFSSICMFLY